MIRLLLFIFRISPKTSDKQIVVLKRNSRHMTSFTEETGDYLLQSASSTNNCSTRSIAVLFRAQRHRSMIRHLWRLYFFYNYFYAPIKLCGIQREKTFFKDRCSCNIECMLIEEMPKDAYLTVCHITNLHYQLTHGFNVRWDNNIFLDDLFLRVSVGPDWINYTSFS